ncbi:MAG: DUF938 domain-containing protein [Acidiferrobacteraceae bacterium]
MKQVAPAAERNRKFIAEVLAAILPASGKVLEIGSGTGQHAVFFAQHMPHLVWQATDLPEQLESIRAWRCESGLPNLPEPLALDLRTWPWPVTEADAVVCINTIHIVPWQCVEQLFSGAARVLPPGGILYAYGPYRYASRPLEPSNEAFDAWLKARDPRSGVRDVEAVHALAQAHGFRAAGDRAMPANNRSLWWARLS